jgi:hypothetical protein
MDPSSSCQTVHNLMGPNPMNMLDVVGQRTEEMPVFVLMASMGPGNVMQQQLSVPICLCINAGFSDEDV